MSGDLEDARVALLPLIDDAIRQIAPLNAHTGELELTHATRRWRLMRQRRQIVRATSSVGASGSVSHDDAVAGTPRRCAQVDSSSSMAD
jgi:hypothetical protein